MFNYKKSNLSKFLSKGFNVESISNTTKITAILSMALTLSAFSSYNALNNSSLNKLKKETNLVQAVLTSEERIKLQETLTEDLIKNDNLVTSISWTENYDKSFNDKLLESIIESYKIQTNKLKEQAKLENQEQEIESDGPGNIPKPRMNPFVNGVLIANHDIREDVLQAIVQGTENFDNLSIPYMMAISAKESGFDPEAKSNFEKSSAKGLYQFTNVSWMRIVKNVGEKHGLKEFSDNIFELKDKRMGVKDWDIRTKLLELRDDPYLSTVMAAEMATDNQNRLKFLLQEDGIKDYEPNETDTYLTHLFGITRAYDFISAYNKNPEQKGADLFKKEAKYNRSIFYDSNGKKRTLEDIYTYYDKYIHAYTTHYSRVLETHKDDISSMTLALN